MAMIEDPFLRSQLKTVYKNLHHCLFCKSKTENNQNVQQGILYFQRKFNINDFYFPTLFFFEKCKKKMQKKKDQTKTG